MWYRKMLITSDTICVRDAFSISCIPRAAVTEIRIERAPLWRGGHRVIIRSTRGTVTLPLNDEVLDRLQTRPAAGRSEGKPLLAG